MYFHYVLPLICPVRAQVSCLTQTRGICQAAHSNMILAGWKDLWDAQGASSAAEEVGCF